MEESIRMPEERDNWRKYVHGVANPRIEYGQRTEQNRISVSSTSCHFCDGVLTEQVMAEPQSAVTSVCSTQNYDEIKLR